MRIKQIAKKIHALSDIEQNSEYMCIGSGVAHISMSTYIGYCGYRSDDELRFDFYNDGDSVTCKRCQNTAFYKKDVESGIREKESHE